LTKLDISRNTLSAVDPAVLAGAVARLQDVDLSLTHMTKQQMVAVLEAICEDTRKRKYLNLCGNDLSVEPSLLARAVNRFEIAIIRGH
jgi:hypothetical protein